MPLNEHGPLREHLQRRKDNLLSPRWLCFFFRFQRFQEGFMLLALYVILPLLDSTVLRDRKYSGTERGITCIEGHLMGFKPELTCSNIGSPLNPLRHTAPPIYHLLSCVCVSEEKEGSVLILDSIFKKFDVAYTLKLHLCCFSFCSVSKYYDKFCTYCPNLFDLNVT